MPKKTTRKYKRINRKTRKTQRGGSFFGDLTKNVSTYFKTTSDTNRELAEMQQYKDRLNENMKQLSETYNNVLQKVNTMHSKIDKLSGINEQCKVMYPSSSSSSNFMFPFGRNSTNSSSSNEIDNELEKQSTEINDESQQIKSLEQDVTGLKTAIQEGRQTPPEQQSNLFGQLKTNLFGESQSNMEGQPTQYESNMGEQSQF